jgi:hypothetical protein
MVVPWLQFPCWRGGLVAAADVVVVRNTSIWESPLFWTSLALVGALLLGALIIALVDRWRKRPAQPVAPAGEQLSYFRSLYAQGDISREEFERIRARLGGRLREQLQVPPKEGGPPAPGKLDSGTAEVPPAEPPPPAPPGA